MSSANNYSLLAATSWAVPGPESLPKPLDINIRLSMSLNCTQMENSFLEPIPHILSHFQVDPKEGLGPEMVEHNTVVYGKNELIDQQKTCIWQMILDQFSDKLVIILLIAAAISFVLALFEPVAELSSFVEPMVILLILLANAAVGIVQETNAEKAIEALKHYSPDEAKAVRGGTVKKIQARDLVPGDIIEVSAGNKIPADCRLISVKSSVLWIDQSILTGESTSVLKRTGDIGDPKAVKQDQFNMLFSGTTVTFGHARAIVVGTGSNTAIGAIHANIVESASEKKTPLKRRLDAFGDLLAKYILGICILVWVVNIRHFNDELHGNWLKGAVYYFKIAVALAVAAIPEGLAVVITTCLALGTKKMAKKNAIVRTLPSVETLGCTSVICSDKTGTLTLNQMCITRLVVVKKNELVECQVTGTSYSPQGQVIADEEVHHEVRIMARIGALCNQSSIVQENGAYKCVGEPTEAAFRVLAEKITRTEPSEEPEVGCKAIEAQYEKLATLDFDRDRKSMSVYCRDSNGQIVGFAKGAPETILERSKYVLSDGKVQELDSELKTRILGRVQEYGTTMALRVLGCALIENPPKIQDIDLSKPEDFVNYEQDMVFVGLVGMEDPPRPEAKEAIRMCREAGIRIIVITGDNKATAESVCRQIGILGKELEGNRSWTGREFDEMSERDQLEAVMKAVLFSRTEPTHKSRLVDLLQQLGHVVAMTGDGVNDAPALKKADIGVAMGSGTDVAKLASDMVLADDNFSTIMSAIQEGRCIYNNTRQFIRYLISSNIGEVVCIFLTVVLGIPEVLIPVQLLWVNLVTDGLPATALGFNPPDHDVMKTRPRSGSEPIVTKRLFARYLVIGSYVGIATVSGYVWWYLYSTNGPRLSFWQLRHFNDGSVVSPKYFRGLYSTKASTMSLSVLVTIEMLNALNSISERSSIIALPPWKNIYLLLAIGLSMGLHFMILHVGFFAKIFQICPLNVEEWTAVVVISFPVLLIDEIIKLVSTWPLSNKIEKTKDK